MYLVTVVIYKCRIYIKFIPGLPKSSFHDEPVEDIKNDFVNDKIYSKKHIFTFSFIVQGANEKILQF